MPLKTKVKFISQSKSGREIKIKDDTGLEVYGKPNGYGINNGTIQSILSYIFELSRIDDNRISILKIDGTNNKLPSLVDIGYGSAVNITSALLEDNGSTKLLASKIFSDGILNIDMYVEFAGIDNVSIVQGNNFITGAVFTNALKADAVLVNDKIYQIDKAEYTNGDSVLYITDYFESNSSSFSVLYRANSKFLLTSVSDGLHAIAVKNNIHTVDDKINKNISYGLCLKTAAQGFVEDAVPDYIIANKMLNIRYNILKSCTNDHN